MRWQSLGLALSLLLLIFTADIALAERPGWQVIKTPHSYPVLIERLNEAVKHHKMGVVTRASATVGAKKMLDKTIPGNMVVGVYRPDFAVRMLEASVAAGIEAPIRFYITANEDGTATLSYKTPSLVFSPYMEEGGKKLKQIAVELDKIFDHIAQDASGP
ncbi:MAG: DUF302 domain-containing protein [Pseudomonadota bacterium]